MRYVPRRHKAFRQTEASNYLLRMMKPEWTSARAMVEMEKNSLIELERKMQARRTLMSALFGGAEA